MRRNDEIIGGFRYGRRANAGSVRVIEKAGGGLEGIMPHPGFSNVKRYRFFDGNRR